MPKLFEALTYGIPGFAQGVVQGKEIQGKEEDRRIKQKQLALQERQLDILERQRLEDLQNKQAQHRAIQGLIQELQGGQPQQIGPVPAGAPGYGGGEEAAAGMEATIPGRPPDQRRMLQQAIQGGLIGKEQMGELFGLGKPQGMMNLAPGGTAFDPRTQRPVFTAPAAPERPVSVAPGGTLVRPGTGEEVFRAAPSARPSRSLTEQDLLILAGKPDDFRIPGFPDYSPAEARGALRRKSEQRGDEAGARTEESLKQQGRLINIIEKITRTKAGAGERGRFEASLDEPITPAEATLYRLPAGTTRRELLAQNPRPITEADIDAGTQFQAARAMLEEYKDVASRLLTAKDAIGSLGQRVRLTFGAFVRTDEDAVRLRALQATVPLLVRALGEKGTLATMDVQRALNAVPDFADTQQTAQAKIKQLEAFIATVEKQIKTLRPGLERRGTPPPPGGIVPGVGEGGAQAPPPSNKNAKGYYEMTDGSRRYWDGRQWQNSRP